MNTFNSELTNAESEVNFWRDFAYWWEAKQALSQSWRNQRTDLYAAL